LTSPPHQPFVCRVCHFLALDSSGLLQHLSDSLQCSVSLRFIPTGNPSENGDGLPSVNTILNDVDEEEIYDICNGMDSSSEQAAHAYDSDPEEDISNGVSHAHAFNHISRDWSNSRSKEEEEEEAEEECSMPEVGNMIEIRVKIE
jgi:hypothetical protein